MGQVTTFPNLFGSLGHQFNNWRQDFKKYAVRAAVLLIALLVFVFFPVNVFKEAIKTPPATAPTKAVDPSELQNWLPWLNVSSNSCPITPLKECPMDRGVPYRNHGG